MRSSISSTNSSNSINSIKSTETTNSTNTTNEINIQNTQNIEIKETKVSKEKISVGIDLGTTYSAIAYISSKQNEVNCISQQGLNEKRQTIIKMTPKSNYSFRAEMFKPTGNNLFNVFLDHKRFLGKTFEECKEIIKEKEYPFELVKSDVNNLVQMKLIDDDNNEFKFYPEEISGFILKLFINLFITQTGNVLSMKDINNIVLAIPVDFDEKQKQAVIRSGKLIGLEYNKNFHFIDEPIASIVSYSSKLTEGQLDLQSGQIVFVIDFGGGTFDVCICSIRRDNSHRKQDGKDYTIDVLFKNGDSNLGGNDFDDIIIEILFEKMKNTYGLTEEEKKQVIIELQKNSKYNAILKSKAEELKKELTDGKEYYFRLSMIESNLSFENEQLKTKITETNQNIFIKREEFEQKIQESDLFTRMNKVIDDTMEEGGFESKDINVVLEIGGTCCIPIVEKTIQQKFSQETKIMKVKEKMLKSVVEGAAYRAHQYSTFTYNQRLTHKLSQPIGIGIKGNKVYRIFDKDTRLPAEKTIKMTLQRNGQSKIIFQFFKGEGKLTTDSKMKKIHTSTIELEKKYNLIDDIQFEIKCRIDTNFKLDVKIFDIRNKDEPLKTLEEKMNQKEEKDEFVDSFQSLQDHFDKYIDK